MCRFCEDGCHGDCTPEWLSDWGFVRECICASFDHRFPQVQDEPKTGLLNNTMPRLFKRLGELLHE